MARQVVPRPGSARPGGPAPWAGLPAGERRGITLAAVLQRLDDAGQRGPLPAPGTVGDVLTISPGDRPGFDARTAAVLVALFEEAGEARVVLTRRSPALRSHRGEVSFPGGRIDDGEDAVAAALREADEEIGLRPGSATVAGWLHPVMTFASGSHITPVVATLATRPRLRASPAEVDRVFDVALADLAADGVFHEERWSVPGRPVPVSPDGSFPVWFFEAADETIWGATARMLTELVCLALGMAAPGPFAAA